MSDACAGTAIVFTDFVISERAAAEMPIDACRIGRAGSTTLKIKLSAAGRKALRRAKRLKVTATAGAADAAANRGAATAKVTLRR